MAIAGDKGAETAPVTFSIGDHAPADNGILSQTIMPQDPDVEVRIRSDERNRIARELHDSTSELLVVLDLQLIRLKQICSASSNAFDQVLNELGATVAELHGGVRALANHEAFVPGTLTDNLIAMTNEFARRTGLVIGTEIGDLPLDVSPEIAGALYRVSQEALANASRHAKSRNVSLRLSADSRAITLRIADDGVGFPRRSASSRGHGIVNMKARVEEIGGRLKIRRMKRGTMVEARVDLQTHSTEPPFMLQATVR